METNAFNYSPDSDYAMSNMITGNTVDQLFPPEHEKPHRPEYQSSASSIGFINDTLALFRWIFYRPIPEIRYWNKRRLSFPSLAVVSILVIALAFVSLYCFLPQPLYWQSMSFGSPPVAIRAGMLAVAMTPWIVATSMKANLITMMTGISHERLNVLHRWGGYLCLFLSLVHAVPFYMQQSWDAPGYAQFQLLFPNSSGYIFGTGIACLVPLGWLCIGSLPVIRSLAYELFLVLHVPISIAYVGLLFWHCRNFLTSWHYLYCTVAIWALSYFIRMFNLNWMNPRRMAWLIGDEAAVTLMAENAIKVTIPTQMKWRPGQFVYLRMPGISIFESHPFTIASLCSEDFPSDYGEMYRDCTLVFRPFGGFTRRVLDTATEKGPFKTYRAYLDGPYGGMQRELAAFDTVILFAGGSGITAIVSQLLNLIKRMRDGKAVTRKVVVVWALKRLEAMDWFREELRICREYAPPDSVTCQFYVTAAVRQSRIPGYSERAPRPISNIFHDKLDDFVAGIASKRNSAMIRDEAQGDPERERELREEDQDAITSLPRQKHLQPTVFPPPPRRENNGTPADPTLARKASLRALEGRKESVEDDHSATHQYLAPPSARQSRREFHFPPPSPRHDAPHFQFALHSPNRMTFPPPPPGGPPSNRSTPQQSSDPFPPPPHSQPFFPPPPAPAHIRGGKSLDLHVTIPKTEPPAASGFNFGFPSTPTEFQKNLMRFAFINPLKKKEGWSTEYGRPDLAYMLKDMATGGEDGRGILGRRTCVFVCGPPSMRIDVANAVAGLQADIWGDESKDEIFLHTENYAI
jgi:predicted ferric reductase